MQIFAGLIDDDSHVFKIDVEEKEYFFDPIGDPIYDESDDEEEIIGEQLSSPNFYEEQEDDEEKQEVVKIAIAPTINSQADRAHDDFVDVSFLFEVVFRSSEFKNTIILLPHHLKMHRIRGRILSNTGRMMQGKLGSSFKNVEITETDKKSSVF
ncbi:MAG: hypothetical protein EOP45_12890 [Sphingobacteriaceae bacterium]|nr:MAG: hypothetical protein EOP45_12890 [Sphingobacteriaceae bacterium]